MAATSQFEPNYFSPPGATLLDTIEALGMTQADLALRLGVTAKHVNQLMAGKAPITSETALRLEHITGVPASFWMNREKNYREALARRDELVDLAKFTDWLKQFPLKEMITRGWIAEHKDKALQIRELLRFFRVASPTAWEAKYADIAPQFRRSTKKECPRGLLSAWLQKGELEAGDVQCSPYDAERFVATLTEARAWTLERADVFTEKLSESFARCGVAIVFVQEFKGLAVSGATRWLTPNKALLQVCLRYKTNDQLWFTIFHEAGHILKHAKKQIFLDDGKPGDDVFEREADVFATNMLIPQAEYRAFMESYPCFTSREIRDFAQKVGIAPGIVVGRLQHERILRFSDKNELKVRLDWAR